MDASINCLVDPEQQFCIVIRDGSLCKGVVVQRKNDNEKNAFFISFFRTKHFLNDTCIKIFRKATKWV